MPVVVTILMTVIIEYDHLCSHLFVNTFVQGSVGDERVEGGNNNNNKNNNSDKSNDNDYDVKTHTYFLITYI